MKLKTRDIWNEYNAEIFFFILKRVRNKDSANEIIQNSFLKIHNNLKKIRQDSKVKPWVFQIVRNEIINFYNESKKVVEVSSLKSDPLMVQIEGNHLCCFDRFVYELPEKHKKVIELVYFDGKKLFETAQELEISLANVKARVRRAKIILKENFKKCCNFSSDKNGKLIGEPNCILCDSVL